MREIHFAEAHSRKGSFQIGSYYHPKDDRYQQKIYDEVSIELAFVA